MSSSAPVAPRQPSAPGSRRAAITARYPEPPKYADDNAAQPVQPACYQTPDRPKKAKLEHKGPRPRFPEAWRGRG